MNVDALRKTQSNSDALKLGFLLAFFLLFAARDFFVPMWGSSEAREAHVAELIAHTGEWILPLRNGLVPSKPPLLHWLAAFLISIFEISGLFAARLVSSIAALLCVKMIADLSFDGLESEPSEAAWWVCAGVLLTSYGFFSLASDARVDMLLCFLVTGAGITLIRGFRRIASALPAALESETKTMQYSVALWCGFAVVAKGPLGIAFPGLLAVVIVAMQSPGHWRSLIPRLGPTVTFLLVALPWYLLAIERGGQGFVSRQIIFENLQRFTGGDGITSKPWHFYAPVFVTTALPWSLVALFSGLSRKIGGLALTSFAIWCAGLVVFSIADGKRASYLLLLLPWVALQVSQALIGYLSAKPSTYRIVRLAEQLFLSLAFLCLIFACLVAIEPKILTDFSIVLKQSASCLLGWLIVMCLFFRASCDDPHLKSLGIKLLAIAGIAITFASTGLAIKGALKGYETAANEISSKIGMSPIYGVRNRLDERLDPFFYLLKRPVVILSPQETRIPRDGFLLASPEWLKAHSFDEAEFLVRFPGRESQLALVKLGMN